LRVYRTQSRSRSGSPGKVFDDDKLMDETYAFAERLASGPGIAIRLTKQSVYQCLCMDFLTALESITGPMGIAARTEDHCEAVDAFKAKRPPQFKGY
jgi:enoyl-CoA hydratase/carnithine racemase